MFASWFYLCVPLYSGVYFYTTSIAEYAPEKCCNPRVGKTAMFVLIELYLEWVVVTYPLDTQAFLMLLPVCPSKEVLNQQASKELDEGCQPSGAVLKAGGRVNTLEDFVFKEYTFSYFVEGVLSGKIDTDDLPRFSAHMEEFYDGMVKKYKELVQANKDNPTAVPPVYHPRTKSRKSNKSKDGNKSDPDCTRYERLLRKAFTFQEEDEEIDDDEHIAYDGTELAKTFLGFHEANAIEYVKFRSSKVRDLYVGGSLPTGGISGTLQLRVQQMKSEKKNFKKLQAREKRDSKKRKAVDGTTPRQSPRLKQKKRMNLEEQSSEDEDDNEDED